MSAPNHHEEFFSARDNLRLYRRATTPEGAKAAVAIVHGFGEHSGRYAPVARSLVEAGFSVHGFDYRGHGQADGRRGHVDQFSEYLDDLDLFLDRVRGDVGDRPLFLFGHSLGGLIVASWILRRGEEPPIAGAILASPYLGLAMRPSPIKIAAARLVGRLVPWLPFDSGIRSEMLTADPEQQRRVDRDPLFNRTVTPRWFEESRRAQREVLAGAGRIRLPILLQVATHDRVASPEVARGFFVLLGSRDRELRTYPARHEIFNEVPEIRRQALADLIAWLQARSG